MEDEQITETPQLTETPQEVSQAVDYFGVPELYPITLPDGVQQVFCQKMNEGARSRYSAAVSQDVTLQRQTGDVKMRLQDGPQRKAMLTETIKDWSVVKRRNPTDPEPTPLSFNVANLQTFISAAPPEVIDHIYEEILKVEKWAKGQLTREDIAKAREDLDRQEAELDAQEATKNS